MWSWPSATDDPGVEQRSRNGSASEVALVRPWWPGTDVDCALWNWTSAVLGVGLIGRSAASSRSVARPVPKHCRLARSAARLWLAWMAEQYLSHLHQPNLSDVERLWPPSRHELCLITCTMSGQECYNAMLPCARVRAITTMSNVHGPRRLARG